MNIDTSIILPAFLLGFMGSTHCLGMCGGISAALGAANTRNAFSLNIAYNIGRVFSYAALGAIVGGATQSLSEPLLQILPSGARWLRTLAGLMIIAMGFYVAGWWRGLAHLETIGTYLWRYIQPLAKNLLPPQHIGAAMLLGSVWGLLPCGLVYSSLTWAALNADAVHGALWMAAFGAGSLPAMLATTQGSNYLRKWTQRPMLRSAAAIALIAAGMVSIALPWLHGQHEQHEHHQQHEPTNHSGHTHFSAASISKDL